MPLYEYECFEHGVFESSARLAESASPAKCPSCHTPCSRILSLVRGAQLPATEVRARDRNLRSQHEPRVVQRSAAPPRDPNQRPKLQRSHASRPWALEHG